MIADANRPQPVVKVAAHSVARARFVLVCPSEAGRITRIVVAILVAVVVPRGSLCQESTKPPLQTGMRAQVAGHAIYDSNIFTLPTPTSDVIWRLSPMVVAQRKSTRSTLLTSGTVGAEWFQDHPELSTPLARVSGGLEFSTQPTPRTILAFSGGSASTMNPSELNVTTGLATGRRRAWEWHAGPEVKWTVTPSTTVLARYQFSRQFSSSVIDVTTHEAGVSLLRQLSPRSEISVKSVSALFAFEPDTTIGSESVLLGLTRKLTDTIAVSLDGGARYTLGSIRPEVMAAITQRTRHRELTLRYVDSYATAFGLPTLLEVRRAQVEYAYRPSVRTRAGVQAAVFVNTAGGSSARVYQLSGSIARTVVGSLALSIDYTRDVQRGVADLVELRDQRLERQALSVGLLVFPLATR